MWFQIWGKFHISLGQIQEISTLTNTTILQKSQYYKSFSTKTAVESGISFYPGLSMKNNYITWKIITIEGIWNLWYFLELREKQPINLKIQVSCSTQ